jgi:hypothetical protein
MQNEETEIQARGESMGEGTHSPTAMEAPGGSERAPKRGVVYLAAFPLGTGSGAVRGSTRGGDVLGAALADDGTGLAEHLSSSVGFAQHDMGLTSDWKHDYYREHFPGGFELVWVDDPATHPGWQAALEKNKALHLAALAEAEGR